MEPGFYRIHLEADDGDWLTLLAPLDETGRVISSKGGPLLFKARWNGDIFYGELLVGEGRIVWGAEAPDSLTDLASVIVQEWALVTIWQEDSRDSDEFRFRVRTVQRL